jgi:hypothetical protein
VVAALGAVMGNVGKDDASEASHAGECWRGTAIMAMGIMSP